MMKIAALDIGGTAIKAGVLDQEGTLLSQGQWDTCAHQGASHLIQQIISIIGDSYGVDRVGISITGQVEPATGVIRFATEAMPGFTGTPLKAILEAETGLWVAVENDVNCAALGEAHFGAAKGIRDFLCVTYGTGIGGAIFIGGGLYYGAHGSAGEFGHLQTHSGDGLLCGCGRRGCYEMYGSVNALIRRIYRRTGIQMDGRQIFARKADEVIARELREWIDEIAWGLVSLVHCFHPPLIVLGGGVMEQEYLLDEICLRLNQWLMPSFRDVSVMPAQLGNRAGLMGAFYKALHFEI